MATTVALPRAAYTRALASAKAVELTTDAPASHPQLYIALPAPRPELSTVSDSIQSSLSYHSNSDSTGASSSSSSPPTSVENPLPDNNTGNDDLYMTNHGRRLDSKQGLDVPFQKMDLLANASPKVSTASANTAGSVWHIEFRGVSKLVRWVSSSKHTHPTFPPINMDDVDGHSTSLPFNYPSDGRGRGRSNLDTNAEKGSLMQKVTLWADATNSATPRWRRISQSRRGRSPDSITRDETRPSSITAEDDHATSDEQHDQGKHGRRSFSASDAEPANQNFSSLANMNESFSTPPVQPIPSAFHPLHDGNGSRITRTVSAEVPTASRPLRHSLVPNTKHMSLTSQLSRSLSTYGRSRANLSPRINRVSTAAQSDLHIDDTGGVESVFETRDLSNASQSERYLPLALGMDEDVSVIFSSPGQRRRRLSKSRPQSYVASNVRGTEIDRDVNHETESYSKRPSLGRKLSKSKRGAAPAHVYSVPHFTTLRPSFLDALPELQPLAPLWPLSTTYLDGARDPSRSHQTYTLPTHPTCPQVNMQSPSRPVFHLGAEEDEHDDDVNHSALGQSSHGHGTIEPQSRLESQPQTTGILKRSVSKRWSAAVTEIADDSDFLRALEIQLAEGGAPSIGIHDISEWSPDSSARSGESEKQQYEHRKSSDSIAPFNLYEETARLDAAKRAMMCVREIVRTERSYLAHLISVAGTQDFAPSSATPFFNHLPRLIAVSKAFSTSLESDTSIWGVSASFVTHAHELESILVKWCSVVGSVINASHTLGDNSSSFNSTPFGSVTNIPFCTSPTTLNGPSLPPAPIVRTGSLHSMKFNRLRRASAVPTVSSRTSVSEDGHGTTARPKHALSSASIRRGGGASFPNPWRRSSSHSNQFDTNGSESSFGENGPTMARATSMSKPLTLQDITIMPTQRVGRYVMLYRDLSKLTPITSRSSPIVCEALHHALRIAKRCDEAQDTLDLLVPRLST